MSEGGRVRSAGARVRATILLCSALVVPLAACGQDPPPAPPQDATAAAELRLGLTEWSIEASSGALLPGQVPVRVTNTGGARHDVVIHGEEGTWASPVLDPGQTHEMMITTVPGEELHLVCTLTGHESQGMHTRIDVADEGEGSG